MVMNQLKYFAPFRTLSISSSLQAIRIFKTTLNTSDPKSDVKMLLLSSLILSTFGFARRILITYCRKRTAESGFSSLVSSEKFTRYSLIIISQFCKFVNLLVLYLNPMKTSSGSIWIRTSRTNISIVNIRFF